MAHCKLSALCIACSKSRLHTANWDCKQ